MYILHIRHMTKKAHVLSILYFIYIFTDKTPTVFSLSTVDSWTRTDDRLCTVLVPYSRSTSRVSMAHTVYGSCTGRWYWVSPGTCTVADCTSTVGPFYLLSIWTVSFSIPYESADRQTHVKWNEAEGRRRGDDAFIVIDSIDRLIDTYTRDVRESTLLFY